MVSLWRRIFRRHQRPSSPDRYAGEIRASEKPLGRATPPPIARQAAERALEQAMRFEELGETDKAKEWFDRAAALEAKYADASSRGSEPPQVRLQREGDAASESVRCSECSLSLTFLGNSLKDAISSGASVHGSPSEGLASFDQWYGNLCETCRRVYCHRCIEVGVPTPCPWCKQPTAPAIRRYLQQ